LEWLRFREPSRLSTAISGARAHVVALLGAPQVVAPPCGFESARISMQHTQSSRSSYAARQTLVARLVENAASSPDCS